MKVDERELAGDVGALSNRILKKDYSGKFDMLRKASVITSHYKYGPVENNFGTNGGVDAIKTLEMCLDKFKETKNTEYLVDVANYAMFRFMFPKDGEFYKPTDSSQSAGISGISQKEMERLRSGNLWD
jgi:hypothetical protein